MMAHREAPIMMLRLTLLLLLALAPGPARAAHHGDFDAPFLRIVQDSNGGALLLDRSGTAVTVWENGLVMESYAPVESLAVVMQNGSGSALELSFDDPLAGDLAVELGSGDRTVVISGDSPEIGGDCSISGGSGIQSVSDDATSAITCNGDFTLVGVNQFSNSGVPLVVGGDLEFSMEDENAPALLDPFYLDVGGSVTYAGSSEVDQVTIGYGYIDVRGKVTIELGDGITGSAQMQLVRIASGGGNDHRIGGPVKISAGTSTNGDRVEVEENVVLAKGIKLALGDGANTVILSENGGKVQYVGGAGQDSVTLGLTSPSVKLQLGDGSDYVYLVAALALRKLAIDFGAANDEYYPGTADPPDAEKLKNLP
jgi:hypothetical protein